MSIRSEKKYNIGLDIGTSSVGWAVTDDNDDVLKYQNNGNSRRMWGSLLFDEGTTAKERRLFRNTRRRYNRRRERINLLQHFFESEIVKEDPVFYRRLEESKLVKEDREYTELFGLFKSKEEAQKYNKEYPTIYHLRYALCNDDRQFDIRFVYLAIHHIIKYRGNFLYENQKFNIKNINIKAQLLEIFKEINSKEVTFLIEDEVNYDYIKTVLLDKLISKKQKQEIILSELKYVSSKKDIVKNVINLLLGLQGNLLKILPLDDITEEEDIKILSKISFNESSFIDNESKVLSLLGDNAYVLEKIKDAYTSIFLLNLFDEVDNPSISAAMMSKYTKHHKDLLLLKKVIKELDSLNNTSNYDKFFRNPKNEIGENYNTYIKYGSKFNYEQLKNKIKLLINDSKEKDLILSDLENDNFLVKLNTVDNSLFPFQLNMDELIKIIEKQSKYYPFLNEEIMIDNEKVYKLVQLLSFRIPYYVGPLVTGNAKSSFAWLEKINDTRITPYNFYDIVDINKSAESFITRMTNFCTYLPKEKVMPKNSLLYSEFMVINEIKQIKINNKSISYDLFKKIFNELFKNTIKPITDKEFKKWLILHNVINDNDVITGYQSENGFASCLKSYNDFKQIVDNIEDYETIKMVERIIEWITIYEDKKILKSRLVAEYSCLNENQIKMILNLRYTGWSRLSRELLTSSEIGYCENGEYFDIIQLMRNTNDNFMQIINKSKYKIEEQINKYNFKDRKNGISYDDVKELTCSPAVKKGIWQSILLTKEIINIMGGMKNKPQHIFLEFARSEDKKVRTSTKKRQILDLYKKIKEETSIYNDNNRVILRELADEKYEIIDDMRLFLYFMQQGKCMYSGTPLNINELSTYEIDHIIPQSLIKDDSIDNRVLVKKEYNQRKSDGSIDATIQNCQKGWWLYLLQHNFISNKKYQSLTILNFNLETINGFINRQLVETRQIVKNVANLLNSFLGDECVCSVRANISHNFREKYQLYKFREMNNIHHAHDAYLAATLGNYILKAYPKDAIYSQYQYKYDKNMKNSNQYGHIINTLEENKAKHICEYLYYNDGLVTRKTEIQTGEFYKQTLYRRKTPGNLIPINKKMSVANYGGYTGEQKSYFLVIEYLSKNKRIKKVVSIPIRFKDYNVEQKIEYFKEKGYAEPVILKDKIGKNQLIFFKNQKFYMSSDSELMNGVEFHFKKEKTLKYRNLLNYILNDKKLYDENHNEVGHDIELIDTLISDILEEMHKHYQNYSNEYNKIKSAIESIGLENISEKDKITLVKQLFAILSANSTKGNLQFLNAYQDSFKFDSAVGRRTLQSITTGKIIFTSLTGLKTNEYIIGEE